MSGKLGVFVRLLNYGRRGRPAADKDGIAAMELFYLREEVTEHEGTDLALHWVQATRAATFWS